MLDGVLQHLAALVEFDTRNPPRAIGTGGIFAYLTRQLVGFDVAITDHGSGSVSLYAVRGTPKYLFNVHLDTVPDAPGWSANPFALRVEGARAVGLGACDVKGAAAALLAAVQAHPGDIALLFTSDEEGSSPQCVREFLATPRAFDGVIVAEPTRAEAVLAHRGIQSVRVRFQGTAGHASRAQGPADSALHQAVRWSAAALDFANAKADEEFGGLRGMRFNLGRLEGGIKPNMIAPSAELRFGMRPLPSMDPDGLLTELRALTQPEPAEFAETFRGPPLPACTPGDAPARLAAATALAGRLALPVGVAVDFWTEAALFSQTGLPTLVFGPGDIAQAHSVDEWVALDQLARVAGAYARVLERGQ
ncbi:MAG TPA: acetylornithine deacetylase [Rhodanobacteraceae bacterium]|nr:acetylornithine deacetylase [Rhodanobacteraceae bacterium]